MATHSSILAWRIPWTWSLVGYSPRGCKESDTTEQLTHWMRGHPGGVSVSTGRALGAGTSSSTLFLPMAMATADSISGGAQLTRRWAELCHLALLNHRTI